ncbi:MAG: ABC transporter substrate-binding protein [Bacillota bacterium]|jgi:branched-chain amino acid transport system substrate-binding protein
MKKILAISLAVMLALTVFAGCGGSDSGGAAGDASYAGQGTAVSGDTIKIGVFEPTTGENGGGGLQEVLGIRYANTIAPTVDIDGTTYNIELVEVDNQSDKTAAVTAAQSLISSDVVAVCGSYGSGVAIAAGQTFADAKVPAVGCSCTNPQVTLGNDFYFRVCFLDPFQGTVVANYAIEEGYKTAAVIAQNGDDYSTGLAAYFKEAFASLGGEIVSEQTYQTNESDFNAILTSIKEANPDVIFVPSSIVTAPLVIQQARALGIEAVIMAGDTWENETIVTTAGADSEGIVFSTFFDENDTENPVANEFVPGFKEWLNADPKNITSNGGSDGVAAVSALGYDSYMAVYEALKGLDGQGLEQITSGDIRDALVDVNFDGVTGNITFNENGDANKTTAYIKTVKDGKITFLRTQEAK